MSIPENAKFPGPTYQSGESLIDWKFTVAAG